MRIENVSHTHTHTHIIVTKEIGDVGNATQLCSYYFYIRESVSRGNFILQENGND